MSWKWRVAFAILALTAVFIEPVAAEPWYGGAPTYSAWYPQGRASLSVSSSSTRVALSLGQVANVCNTGAVDGYAALGDVTVVATTSASYIIRAGRCKAFPTNAFGVNSTYLAGITSSSTTTFTIETGIGLPPTADIAATSSGGGAATIADGADVAEGTTTDGACAGDATSGCTLLQRLSRIASRITSVIAGTTVTQATGTNLHVVTDTTSTTAVTQATAANLNAAVVGTGTAGSAAGGVLTVQGAASMTPVRTLQNDGTNSVTINAASTSPGLTAPSLTVAVTPNPAPVCTGVTAISQITSTDVKTFTNFGYICSIVLISDTSQFIALIEGTGTVCATGTTVLAGSATVASGMSIGATGGFSAVAGVPFMKTQATGDHFCILQSGVGRVSGFITWQDHS